MEAYLLKKGIDQNTALNTIKRLEDEKLLDDRAFAAQFVEQRERFNPKSKFALKYELKKKGIDTYTIDERLMDIDEFVSAWNGIEPKIRMWQGYDDDKFRKKVMNFLKNRGFGYEVSAITLERALGQKGQG
ncbi:MAG: RecX family transcriptional regulator [Desulfamplus sp.]|nr:RecX family transcriptional regulator [Desulfamplus sp.]